MTLNIKRILLWATLIVSLLLVPLIGMQFTNDIKWDLLDFAIMLILLMGLAFIYEFIAGRSKNKFYKIALALALFTSFMLFWVNAAVGIIGNENQSPNLLYFSVFGAALLGSTISKFKPAGMAITFFIVSLIQFSIPLVAIFIWPPEIMLWTPSVLGIFLFNSIFVILFFISGIIFKKAAELVDK